VEQYSLKLVQSPKIACATFVTSERKGFVTSMKYLNCMVTVQWNLHFSKNMLQTRCHKIRIFEPLYIEGSVRNDLRYRT